MYPTKRKFVVDEPRKNTTNRGGWCFVAGVMLVLFLGVSAGAYGHNALHFNRGSVVVPHADVLNPGEGDFTAELWVRTDEDADGWNLYFEKVGDGSRYYVADRVTGEHGWHFEYQGPDGQSRTGTEYGYIADIQGRWVYVQCVADVNTQTLSLRVYDWENDEWHEASIPFDGTHPPQGAVNPTGDLWLSSVNFPVKGILSDVRFYNTARTQADAERDMQAQLTGEEEGLIGYWPMDEGTGDTVQDRTANGNHGTIEGAADWVQVDDHPLRRQIVETAPRSHVNVAPGGQTELGPVLLFGDYEADATFQWYKDGVELEGQTGAGLLIDNANIDDHAGTYTVRVSHPLLDEPLEYDIVVRVAEVGVPAAGVAGLLAAGGLIVLAGVARTGRQRH